MNWVATGTIKDNSGFRNVCLSRNGVDAVISFKDAKVQLVNPPHSKLFKDFVELERWLATSDIDAENDNEINYYRAIDNYIRSVGYYELLLELQGTDEEYCKTVMRMHRAAYRAKQSEKIVGALTLDSVKHYYHNRELSLSFLEALEIRWNGNNEEAPTKRSILQIEESQNLSYQEFGINDDSNFHPALDNAVDTTIKFLISHEIFVPVKEKELGIYLHAELVVYIASFLAMIETNTKMAQGSWNTFKRSIENRMLEISDDGSTKSGTISTPDGVAFAHFTSGYWDKMSKMEDLVLIGKGENGEMDLTPLIQHLLNTQGSDQDKQEEFSQFFTELHNFASVKSKRLSLPSRFFRQTLFNRFNLFGSEWQ